MALPYSFLYDLRNASPIKNVNEWKETPGGKSLSVIVADVGLNGAGGDAGGLCLLTSISNPADFAVETAISAVRSQLLSCK